MYGSNVKIPKPSDQGTLLYFHGKFGGGKRKHKDATADLLSDKEISGDDMAEVIVHLYKSEHLDSAKKEWQAFVTWAKDRTIPWADDGGRFVPNSIKSEMDAEIVRIKPSIEGHINKFFDSYDEQIKRWTDHGGKLSKGIEFPDKDKLRSKVGIKIVPGTVADTNDIRAGGLSGDQLDRFIKDMQASEKDKLKKTMSHIVERVEKVLTPVITQCSAYTKDENGNTGGKKIYESMIGNVRNIAGLIEVFNITRDPEIEAVRRRLINEICPLETKDLKNSQYKRDNAVRNATSIKSQLGRFGAPRD